MSKTRRPMECELGQVELLGHGWEGVMFSDAQGRPCTIHGSPLGFVRIWRGQHPMLLRREQIRDLICTLGRYLETGSFVDTGD